MWIDILKSISDRTRLRILNLLFLKELNVNEIIEVLANTQSNISKHLKILKSIGLIRERKEGTWRFYSISSSIDSKVKDFLKEVFEEKDFKEDIAKLKIISEKRNFITKKFFSSNESCALGKFYSLENLLISFSFLIPSGYKILDAGCGEGKLLKLLVKNRHISLYGIDLYRDFVDISIFSEDELKFIKFYKEDITKTHFDDNFFDMVFMNMVLHHIEEPKLAIKEVARLIKKGGKVLIIDFYKHSDEFMREKYGDFWLGFDLDYIKSILPYSLLISDYYLLENKEGLPYNFIIHIEKK